MNRAGPGLFGLKSLLLSIHGIHDLLPVIHGLNSLYIGVPEGRYASSTDQAQGELVRLLEKGAGHLSSYSSAPRDSSLSRQSAGWQV